MSTFSSADFAKHDYRYSLKLLEMISSGKEIGIGNNSQLGKFVFDKNSSYVRLFKDSIKKKSISIPKGEFTSKNNKFKFVDIDKSPFSGVGKNSSKVPSGINIDDAREVAVALVSLALINKKKDSASIFEFLKNIKKIPAAMNKLSVDSDVSKVYQFLFDNPDKFKIAYNCADTIVKTFKGISSYTFHHKDPYFLELKKRGTELSGLKEDKWNPADLILTKNKKEIVLKTNKLIEYNKWCSDDSKRLQISLKEGESAALHGAISIGSLSKQMGYKDNPSNMGAKTNKYDKTLVEFFKNNIKKLSSLSKVHFLFPKGVKNITGCVSYMSKKTNSNNYFKAVPVILDFLKNHNNQKEIDSIAESAYIYSKSSTERSCPYHKIMGNKYDYVKAGKHNIKLDDVYIPINGETQVVFNLTVDGKKIKLQCRSKGSLPQFMVLNEVYKPNLSEVELVKINQSTLR